MKTTTSRCFYYLNILSCLLTHIGRNSELVVVLLEGLGLQVIPPNLHVVRQERLAVRVDPVEHLKHLH
jgi:hypothetical protein